MTAPTEYVPRRALVEPTPHQQMTERLNAITREWLDAAVLAGDSLTGRQKREHAAQVRAVIAEYGA